jgi:threonine dehydratase
MNAPPKPCVTLDDVLAARERIRGGVELTPCPASLGLSRLTEKRIYCKLDSLQATGSFKERGARNALLQLDTTQQKQGVIAASAGNHALGLSYHGGQLGIPVTVVMPVFAPLIKISTCRTLGARVILEGDSFQSATAHARKLGEEQGLEYIHGFNDPRIIAGQGTMALEILEQVPDLRAIVVPAGGCGLLAGIAVVMRALRPDVEIIAVEDARMPSFAAALKAGQPVQVAPLPTLADGLAVGKVGDNSFALARDGHDRLLHVSEDDIALAILRLMELEKCVVEGAAATPLAAAMRSELDHLRGEKVVLCLCGGNIDLTSLGRVIDRGLVLSGRLCRFTAIMPDRPGALARLTQLIAAAGANVREVYHERAFSDADLATVHIGCTVETTDQEHRVRLLKHLEATEIQLVKTENA